MPLPLGEASVSWRPLPYFLSALDVFRAYGLAVKEGLIGNFKEDSFPFHQDWSVWYSSPGPPSERSEGSHARFGKGFAPTYLHKFFARVLEIFGPLSHGGAQGLGHFPTRLELFS